MMIRNEFSDYDAGLINDHGGGDVGWWQDYIRSEIQSANEHWRAQIEQRADSAVPEGWQPMETAPKDGSEVLCWNEHSGMFIASYTSADSFPLSQSEIDESDEEALFQKDWFTQWPQALRLEGSELPTKWMPLPTLLTAQQPQTLRQDAPETDPESQNSPELRYAPPEGWLLVPAVPSTEHLDSIAMRDRHDFGLLDEEQKDNLRRSASQLYEEATGQGSFKIPGVTAPQPAEQQPAPDVAGLVEALETALFGTPLDDVPNRDNDDIWRVCHPHLPERVSDALRDHLARIETALAPHRKQGGRHES